MIVVFALAQLADGISGIVAVLSRPAFREMSAIPAFLMVRPEWAFIVKVLSIATLLAIIVIVDRVKPRLATALLALGIVAGAVGLISNLAVLAA